MSVRPAFAGGSHDRQNRRVGRKEGIDPRGEFVARPTPVASEAEAGMVVDEIERLDKESAGGMVGERKRVVEGKRVSGRVDTGGRRIIKKKIEREEIRQ